jgi:5-methylcytosine-specific restriction endonuclease McrA
VPSSPNYKRDYKQENKYKSKPDQIEKRVQRNKARREAMEDGLVRKGDGKQVDHKTPLSKGGSNDKSNLRIVHHSTNESFSRNKDGSMKSQTSKREKKR